MGFITTLTVNNDLLHELNSRPYENTCRAIYDGLMRVNVGNKPVSVHVAGITVVETHHADAALAILVGGGKEAEVITGVSIHYKVQDPEMELLRQLAVKRGFNLQRKRKRKE